MSGARPFVMLAVILTCIPVGEPVVGMRVAEGGMGVNVSVEVKVAVGRRVSVKVGLGVCEFG